MPNKNNSRPAPMLQATFLSGLILLLLMGGVIAGIYTTVGSVVASGQERAFSRLLGEYDNRLRQIMDSTAYAVQLPDLAIALDRLEKRATGVETWLSILKRRRALAQIDSRYWQNYRQSVQQAAAAYPYAEPVAAIAAAALVHDAAITREKETELRRHSALLTSPRFIPMKLSLHVLLGDLKNQETAAAKLPQDINWYEEIMAWDHLLDAAEGEAVATDLALMKNDEGGMQEAVAAIQGALAIFRSPALIHLAAEYFYDFGDMRHSAELFSMLQDEEAVSRQADALWLAGNSARARNVWAAAAETGSPAVQSRFLYNLAVTENSPASSEALLKRLAELDAGDSSRLYGLIRYSRLFESPQAIAVLRQAPPVFSPPGALVELEILKRRTDEAARKTAETWELLNKYPEEENLCEWGAWYFDLHHNYAETALLLRNAARNNFSGEWVSIHEGLRLIREGRLEAAEDTLAGIAPESRSWAALANIGRIQESRHGQARAVEHYNRAMEALLDGDGSEENWQANASRIQVRLARCFGALGMIPESREALEYAIDLNPDNLNARFELGRLIGSLQ